jgi:hypothetical protein
MALFQGEVGAIGAIIHQRVQEEIYLVRTLPQNPRDVDEEFGDITFSYSEKIDAFQDPNHW